MVTPSASRRPAHEFHCASIEASATTSPAASSSASSICAPASGRTRAMQRQHPASRSVHPDACEGSALSAPTTSSTGTARNRVTRAAAIVNGERVALVEVAPRAADHCSSPPALGWARRARTAATVNPSASGPPSPSHRNGGRSAEEYQLPVRPSTSRASRNDDSRRPRSRSSSAPTPTRVCEFSRSRSATSRCRR
jgi:hypothetical protein